MCRGPAGPTAPLWRWARSPSAAPTRPSRCCWANGSAARSRTRRCWPPGPGRPVLISAFGPWYHRLHRLTGGRRSDAVGTQLLVAGVLVLLGAVSFHLHRAGGLLVRGWRRPSPWPWPGWTPRCSRASLPICDGRWPPARCGGPVPARWWAPRSTPGSPGVGRTSGSSPCWLCPWLWWDGRCAGSRPRHETPRRWWPCRRPPPFPDGCTQSRPGRRCCRWSSSRCPTDRCRCCSAWT